VDLLIARDGGRAVVRTTDRGAGVVSRDERGYHYRRDTGDPLGVGRDVCGASSEEAYDAMCGTDYPDGIVQIAHLAASPRSGELILSAARDWDFRSKHEPIPHVSSHGALHRDHMLVPLLVNRPVQARPRRTVDVMPSALAALGKPIPPGLDGSSFVRPGT
jgi:hypothetical protein